MRYLDDKNDDNDAGDDDDNVAQTQFVVVQINE